MRTSLSDERSPSSFILAANSLSGYHFVSMKIVLSDWTETRSSLFDSGFLSGRSVCGSMTGLPFCSIGVTTMKMMRRTRHTSTSGVTLMSLFMSCRPPKLSIPIAVCSFDPSHPCGKTLRGLGGLALHEVVDELGSRVRHLHLEALDLVQEEVV